VEVERGRVIHSFELSEGLEAGQVLQMSLLNMPIYNPVWRRIVITSILIMCSLFLILWYRFWRKEQEQEDADDG
jgi:hypothetical protein